MLLEDPVPVLRELESKRAFDAFSCAPIQNAVVAFRDAWAEGRRLGGPEAIEVMRAAGADEETWLAEVRSRLLREPEGHAVGILVDRLVEGDRLQRLRALREQLARSEDPEEELQLLREVRRVQSGEL